MILRQPPDPVKRFLDHATALFDRRHAELVEPLFVGELLAHGRRTATAWFRAGGIADDFRRAYSVLGTLGKSKVPACAGLLFRDVRRAIDPGPRWLLGLDDTPTRRYGPCVEGAGLHHNPTRGQAAQKYFWGHLWVSLAWVVKHPLFGVIALPLRALLLECLSPSRTSTPLEELFIRTRSRAGRAPRCHPARATSACWA